MSEHQSLDPFETFRSMVQPGAGQEWLKTAASQFWLNQDHLLDCIEKTQKGWLARRHEGARAASDATVAMLSAENPAAAAAEYQKWATGARERVMADASELQQLMSAAASSMFEPISSPLSGIPHLNKVTGVSNAA